MAMILFKSTVLFGSLSQLITPTFETILQAVPKMKCTRYRIRRRLTTQYQLPLTNINTCKVCGQECLVHHLCVTCLKTVLVGGITEIGDALIGKPVVRPEWLTQRIKKARGLNNSLRMFEQRNGKKDK